MGYRPRKRVNPPAAGAGWREGASLRILTLLWCALARRIATFGATTEHLHRVGADLGRVSVLPVLVLPLAGLDLTST